jgi:hypothetical protein
MIQAFGLLNSVAMIDAIGQKKQKLKWEGSRKAETLTCGNV